MYSVIDGLWAESSLGRRSSTVSTIQVSYHEFTIQISLNSKAHFQDYIFRLADDVASSKNNSYNKNTL